MRLSWYADTGVAVFSIWQGGTCTGTFRLPVADLPRMVQILQRGPHGDAGQAGHADGTGQHAASPGGQRSPSGGQHSAPGGRHSGSHARPLSDEPTGIYRPEDDWTPPGYSSGPRTGYQEEPPPGYRPGPSGHHAQPPARYQQGPPQDHPEGPGGPPRGYGSHPSGYQSPPPGYFEEPPEFGGAGEVPGYGDPGEFGAGSYDESPVRPYVAPSREPADERAGESFPYRLPPAPPPPRRRPRNHGGH
jgi:hypothetical protein